MATAIVPTAASDTVDTHGMALEEYLPPLPEDEQYTGYTSSRRRRRKSRKYNTRTRKLARWIARKILASAAAKGAAYRAKMAADEAQRARAPKAGTNKGGKQLQVYDPDTVPRGSLFSACFAWCTTLAAKEESTTPTSEQGAQCDLDEPAQLPAPVEVPTMQAVPVESSNEPTMRVRCHENPADMSADELHLFLKNLTREQRSKLRHHLSVATPRVSSPRPVITPREKTISPRAPKETAFANVRTGTTPRLGISPKMSASPARAMRPVMTEVPEHARPQPASTRRGAAVAMSMPVFELQPWQDEAVRPSTAGAAVQERTVPELHKVATCPTDKLTSSLSDLVINTGTREQ